MKKKKRKIWKKILIFLISLVGILYLTVYVGHTFIFKESFSKIPTVDSIVKDGMKFGAASIEQPKTFDEYIEVLSSQMKNYNKHLEAYWPNNPVTDQYLIAQNSKNKKAVLINPKGEVSELSKSEFKSYGIPKPLNLEGQWASFSANGKSGAYISVFVDNLNNYYSFQKYEHLGTYDQFLSYSHELFHSITQEKWSDGGNLEVANADKDERMEDSEARRTRMLLQQQLSQAFCSETEEETEQNILAALKTFEIYKTSSKEDFEKSVTFDRLEGTAYYYELVSSLYAAYPEQIKNQDDVYKGLKIILENDNPAYRASGLNSEGYTIGGYAGLVLDKVMLKQGEDPNEWKIEIEKDSTATPLTILEKKYADKTLPEQAAIPTEKEYRSWLEASDKISPSLSSQANLFSIAYGILFR